MKLSSKIIFLTMLSVGLTNAVKSQNIKFRIDARIDGIETGDTLRFSKVILPQWTLEHDFDMIVERSGYAEYKGKSAHSQLYLMEYFPMHGKAPYSDRRGKSLLIGSGTTKISGTRSYIYYSAVESKLYDKQLLDILVLEDSLGRIRGDLIKDLNASRAGSDSVELAHLSDEFNNFASVRKRDFDRLREKQRNYDMGIGGEYTASAIAQRTSDPVEELKKGYEKLSSEAKKSHYGRLVADMVSRMENLAEGKFAPEVNLTTIDGREIKVSDFRGKYLLIYNFGMCPYSFQMDHQVSEFYNEYADRLELIGITDSFKALKTYRNDVSENVEIFGLNLKGVLNGMLAHPWKNDVESTSGNNAVFSSTYFAIGLPYFIFISPEGKIISRAIGSETFQIAVKVLTDSN